LVIYGTFGTVVTFGILMLGTLLSTLGIICSVFWYILVHVTFGTPVGTLH